MQRKPRPQGHIPTGPRPTEYISKAGHETLLSELSRLRSQDRPKMVDEVATAAAQGDRSENAEYIYGKKKLREIDRRMGFLERRLAVLVPMDVDAPRASEKCYFGAWVTIEDEDSAVVTYRIVGVDEVNPERGYISYKSPLGRALLGKSSGDAIVIKSPRGDRDVSITSVVYGKAP